MSKWTRFMDMHSGGGCKTGFEYTYIEAPRVLAESVFERVFGRDPNNVTCDCCGADYSIGEEESLNEATEYERGKKSVKDWIKRKDVRVIRAKDIK